MASSYGHDWKFSLFGESHGTAVGGVIDHPPAGLKIDFAHVERRLRERRDGAFCLAPYGQAAATSPAAADAEARIAAMITRRREPDEYEILSGVSDGGITTGSPLTVLFRNRDIDKKDYHKYAAVYRPGHADYVSAVRSRGYADLAGGGHFSGRLTAPLVFAGAIAEQVLARNGITIRAELVRIGGVGVALQNPDALRQLSDLFSDLEQSGDTVGSKVRVQIDGLPVGAGGPFFDTLEGEMAKAVFAVPGIKGIEFGSGFQLADARGSQAIDAFYRDGDERSGTATATIRTKANHNGGINGGLSNGMPVVFRAAIKPASGTALPIATLNFRTMEEDVLVIDSGRHDKCIGLRAMAGVVAAAALVLVNAEGIACS